jgi:hypothetical protein
VFELGSGISLRTIPTPALPWLLAAGPLAGVPRLPLDDAPPPILPADNVLKISGADSAKDRGALADLALGELELWIWNERWTCRRALIQSELETFLIDVKMFADSWLSFAYDCERY